MNRRAAGGEKEQEAKRRLEAAGVRILEANYRVRAGEVDLIGLDGDYLVFFEVKWRGSLRSGHASEAVDRHKQARICKVCDFYRMQHKQFAQLGVRFDVIALEPGGEQWIKNAFDYIGSGF